jgi:hypothetical protein
LAPVDGVGRAVGTGVGVGPGATDGVAEASGGVPLGVEAEPDGLGSVEADGLTTGVVDATFTGDGFDSPGLATGEAPQAATRTVPASTTVSTPTPADRVIGRARSGG